MGGRSPGSTKNNFSSSKYHFSSIYAFRGTTFSAFLPAKYRGAKQRCKSYWLTLMKCIAYNYYADAIISI
jgi:hypothetical protein